MSLRWSSYVAFKSLKGGSTCKMAVFPLKSHLLNYKRSLLKFNICSILQNLVQCLSLRNHCCRKYLRILSRRLSGGLKLLIAPEKIRRRNTWDISYCDSVGRKLVVHLRDTTYRFSGNELLKFIERIQLSS